MSLNSNDLRSLLTPFLSAPRWLVAYSGGVDSHVLLHFLAGIDRHPPIVALHINHQLQPQSGQWALHCQQQAKALSIDCQVLLVEVSHGSRQSLEEQARLARYKAFDSMVEAGDILMLGHHRDDQVETLLLRLLRGSGATGSAGMPQSRGIGRGLLFRPFLNSSQADINEYAQQQHLQWQDDPSNESLEFDRNFLRHEVFPILAQRWPDYSRTLARSAALNQQAAELNTELAILDFHALGLLPTQLSISIRTLTELSPLRQKNVLRHWFASRGLTLPSAVQLQAVLDEVIHARQDAEPLLSWKGASKDGGSDVEIRRFKDELYSMVPLSDFDSSCEYHWDSQSPLVIDGVGRLSFVHDKNHSIDPSLLKAKTLVVRFRCGGERCQPVGRGASQLLKKLFQEYSLETWWRDRAPLLYCDNELVAVAGLWVCEGWQAPAGKSGLSLRWQKNNLVSG